MTIGHKASHTLDAVKKAMELEGDSGRPKIVCMGCNSDTRDIHFNPVKGYTVLCQSCGKYNWGNVKWDFITTYIPGNRNFKSGLGAQTASYGNSFRKDMSRGEPKTRTKPLDPDYVVVDWDDHAKPTADVDGDTFDEDEIDNFHYYYNDYPDPDV